MDARPRVPGSATFGKYHGCRQPPQPAAWDETGLVDVATESPGSLILGDKRPSQDPRRGRGAVALEGGRNDARHRTAQFPNCQKRIEERFTPEDHLRPANPELQRTTEVQLLFLNR